MTDLTKGIQLTTPPKFVPWRISDLELEDLFNGFALKKVKRGYYTLKCEPLPSLHCHIGFHLHQYDVLTQFEFFVMRNSHDEIKDTFAMFQKSFEVAFGPSTKTSTGPEGFPSHEWTVPGARIIHLVRERHGPEEIMTITKA